MKIYAENGFVFKVKATFKKKLFCVANKFFNDYFINGDSYLMKKIINFNNVTTMRQLQIKNAVFLTK